MAKREMMTGSGKSEKIRANQDLAGIPESKRFAAPHAEGSGEDRILKCHISGVEISRLGLDPQVLAALDYWATDEGVAEKNARPEVREPSGVKLGRDEFSKALDQRKEEVRDRDFPMYEARNPLKEVADRYAQPGMSSKFLSASKIKDSGGTGDYEVVKNEAGDPVRVKGMVLGHMPTRMAEARNKHYRDKGQQLLKQIDRQFKAEAGPAAVSDQDK